MKKFRILVIGSSLLFTQISIGRSTHFQYSSVSDSLNIIEKVYLHVDRDSYNAGDDVWFKAYLIDASDRQLTNHSRNLHVDIIAPSSKIILNCIIRLESGLGNGDFKLPADIKSGRYRLRAYTNYMRNFGDQLFFTKEIIVINSNETDKTIDKVKYVENQIQLTFFPEGGSLIDNVSSNVAFKAVNNLGKGCDVTGKIFSSKGDLITTFKSTHLGMGSFFLRPAAGLAYYSVYKGADSIEFKTQLPVSFTVGVTFSVSMNQDDEMLITTKTNSQTLPSVAENGLILSFSIRKEVIKTIPYKISSTVSSFVIPSLELPDGIIMLTLSATNDLPLSERLVYIQNETPPNIQIETDKTVYSKRDPVSIKISMSGDSTIENDANISLSAVNDNLINNTSRYPRTIASWFLLESDVRGYVEDPSYYFDQSNPERLSDMDLLLRTQGWRDFAWKYDTTYFPPENGFTVSGRLRKNNKNKPVEDARVSIGIFGTRSNLIKTVPVDSIGRFKLSGVDLIGGARIVASGIDQKDRLMGTLFIDSVAYNPAKVHDSLSVVSTSVNFNQSKLRSYYIINEVIRKKYKLSDTLSIGEVHIISERHKDPQTIKIESSRLIYGTPDAELIITDHMEGYTNLPELMKGKFPGVEVVGPRDGNYYIYFRGLSTINGDPNPLLLIDGNPVSFDEFRWIPISLIERIDVLKLTASTSIYGLQGGCGVINLITKAGGVSGVYKPVEYSANIKISGYNSSRIFYSPQHLPDSNSDYNPDLRSTLYWNPYINLKGDKEAILNYYNGDNSSLIRIIAEGITTTGIPVTGKAVYEVK